MRTAEVQGADQEFVRRTQGLEKQKSKCFQLLVVEHGEQTERGVDVDRFYHSNLIVLLAAQVAAVQGRRRR